MMHRALQLLLIATLALLGACRNGGAVVDTGGRGGKVPAGQVALLEHEYTNFAWGYQHRGVVVTGDGSVIGYEWAREERPWVEPEGGTITGAELEAKYDHARTRLGSVGADTLALIERLIPAAQLGKLTERQMRGADMGETERLAWMLDTATGRYRKTSLRVDGDWSWQNTAPEAARLSEIIDAIVARYGR